MSRGRQLGPGGAGPGRVRSRLLPACWLACALVACDSQVVTEFPDGLEPLEEENLAPLPEPEPGQPHPERIEIVAGVEPDFEFAHGRGYVHASLAKVWEALRTPEVCIDRREVNEWTVTYDVEEGFDVSFRTHNTVHQLATVHFDVTWRQAVVEGTANVPQLVLVRGQKTEGTSYITYLADSVVARRVEDDVTELEFIRHIKAIAAGRREAEQFIADFYESIRAVAQGEPLPTY